MFADSFFLLVRVLSDDLVELQSGLGVLAKTIPSTPWTRSGALFPSTTPQTTTSAASVPPSTVPPRWSTGNTLLVAIAVLAGVGILIGAALLLQRRRRPLYQSYELVNRLWEFETTDNAQLAEPLE